MKTTPSIGYSNQLTDDLSIRLRWGEGFVAPETSTSISAGFNWEYFENHSIDVAYYQIDVENVISWSNLQDIVFADALGVQWDPNGTRVERTGGFVTKVVSYADNVNRLEASGVDIQLHSSFDTGWGYFDLGVMYSLQLSYKENAYYDGGLPGDPQLCRQARHEGAGINLAGSWRSFDQSDGELHWSLRRRKQ